MGRLFRDWRFALLWVVGISAMATAFVADRNDQDQSLVRAHAQEPMPASTGAAMAALQSSPAAVETEPDEEATDKFGAPVMDTTPFDPNPVAPGQTPSAAPADPAVASTAPAAPASAPAPAAL